MKCFEWLILANVRNFQRYAYVAINLHILQTGFEQMSFRDAKCAGLGLNMNEVASSQQSI